MRLKDGRPKHFGDGRGSQQEEKLIPEMVLMFATPTLEEQLPQYVLYVELFHDDFVTKMI